MNTTRLILNSIVFHIVNLKELQNKIFTFQLSLEEGYIDASIYINSIHHAVEVPKIEFGVIKNNSIPIKIDYRIDYTSLDGLNKKDLAFGQINTDLELKDIRINSNIAEPKIENTDTAKQVLSKFYDLNDLEEPAIRTNTFGEVAFSFGFK